MTDDGVTGPYETFRQYLADQPEQRYDPAENRDYILSAVLINVVELAIEHGAEVTTRIGVEFGARLAAALPPFPLTIVGDPGPLMLALCIERLDLAPLAHTLQQPISVTAPGRPDPVTITPRVMLTGIYTRAHDPGLIESADVWPTIHRHDTATAIPSTERPPHPPTANT